MLAFRKGLAIAGLIIGLAILLNNYFFIYTLAANPDTGGAGQVIWDIIDPLVVVVLAAITLVRVSDALRGGGTWAGHLLTMAFGVVAMQYLHNLLIKWVSGWQEANVLAWYLLVPAVVVLLAAYAVEVFRKEGRE